jgi:hypothetical protein
LAIDGYGEFFFSGAEVFSFWSLAPSRPRFQFFFSSPASLFFFNGLHEVQPAAVLTDFFYAILFTERPFSRLSGSKRNAQRLRTELDLEQKRFEREAQMLYENQHAHMEERLRLRAESRERQQKIILQHEKAATMDPFSGMDEAVAQFKAEQERKRRSSKNQTDIIGQLELKRSDDESDSDSTSSEGD